MKKLEITFAELAKKLNIDLNTTQEVNIEEYGIEIESFNIKKDKKIFKPMTRFVVKDPVDKHYNLTSPKGEELKTTSVHRTWDKEKQDWVQSYDRYIFGENVSEVDERMQVVDCTVEDTDCYIANGFINHNTTPGGKALKFAAS